MSKKKSLLLRLDPKVHAAIQKWAADELRSVNAQIELHSAPGVDQSGPCRQSGRRR